MTHHCFLSSISREKNQYRSLAVSKSSVTTNLTKFDAADTMEYAYWEKISLVYRAHKSVNSGYVRPNEANMIRFINIIIRELQLYSTDNHY